MYANGLCLDAPFSRLSLFVMTSSVPFALSLNS